MNEVTKNTKLLSLEFLWNSAKNMKNRGSTNRNLDVVQSQLRERCLNLAQLGAFDYTTAFDQSEVCRTCGNPWSEGAYKLKILHHEQKVKQLKKKLSSSPEKLSKYHKHLLSLFSKRKDNVLKKQCAVCKTCIKIGLNKPAPWQEEGPNIASMNEGVQTESKKRKKKSKKDRFSGLLPSAVMNANMARMSLDDSTFGSVTDSSATFAESTCSEITLLNDSLALNNTKSVITSSGGFTETIPMTTEYAGKSDQLESPHATHVDSFVTPSKTVNFNISSLSSFKSNKKRKNDAKCDTISKKQRKVNNKNLNKLALSNSYISFNDDSIFSDNFNSSRHSPNLNSTNVSLKSNQNSLVSLDSSKNQQHINQNSNKKSKKKKKKSGISDFLKLL